MAALTADVARTRRTGDVQLYTRKTGATIYSGALVCINSDGLLVPAADTAGLKFVGVSLQSADDDNNPTGFVAVQRVGEYLITPSTTLLASTLQTSAYAVDDQTVATTSTNSILVGTITEIDSDGNAWVKIGA